MRWIICGGPNTGKTTLAGTRGTILHTDGLIGDGSWKDQVATVARYYESPGPWTVEGVLTIEALERWLADHPDGKPADRITYLTTPLKPLTPGAANLTKGLRTRWARIVGELIYRDVEIDIG